MELVMFAFDSVNGAQDFAQALTIHDALGHYNLVDAASVIRLADGSPQLVHTKELAGNNSLGGVFWGVLLGLVLWAHWWGLTIGGAVGSVGLDDDFVREAGDLLGRGHSALFLLTPDGVADQIENEFLQFEPKVLRAALDQQSVQRLYSVFQP